MIPKPNARVTHITCTQPVTLKGKGLLSKSIFCGHESLQGLEMFLCRDGVLCKYQGRFFIVPHAKIDTIDIHPDDCQPDAPAYGEDKVFGGVPATEIDQKALEAHGAATQAEVYRRVAAAKSAAQASAPAKAQTTPTKRQPGNFTPAPAGARRG